MPVTRHTTTRHRPNSSLPQRLTRRSRYCAPTVWATCRSAFPTKTDGRLGPVDWGRRASTSTIGGLPESRNDPYTLGPPSTHQEKSVTSALEKIDSTTVKITVTLTEEEVAPSMAVSYTHLTLPTNREV